MKQTYGAMEIYVFEEKRDQTVELMRAMNELIKKIEGQQDALQKEGTSIKAKLNKIKPDNKETRARHQKILADIIVILDKVQTSREKLAREISEKEVLAGKQAETERVVSQLTQHVRSRRWPRRPSS